MTFTKTSPTTCHLQPYGHTSSRTQHSSKLGIASPQVTSDMPSAADTNMESRGNFTMLSRTRRHSCPSLDAHKLLMAGNTQDCATTVTGKRANTGGLSKSVTMIDIHYPKPKLSIRLSTQSQTSLRPRRESLKLQLNGSRNRQDIQSSDTVSTSETQTSGVQTARRKNSHPIVADSTVSTFQTKKLAEICAPKNEAEIVDYKQRRSSLPDKFGPGSAVVKAGGQGQSRRKGSSESVDRELRSLYRNSLEERRLQQAVNELEKQSFAGTLEHRNRKNQIFRDFRKLIMRSPKADDWLLMQKSRTNTLQERERDDIARRYSRRARHFRAPPYLQETVAKVRSFAMFEAGLLQPSEPASNTCDDQFNDAINKLSSLRMSRRHTISGDEFTASAPKLTTSHVPVLNACLQGRRVSMGDIKTLRDILEFRSKLTRSYIGGIQSDQDNINLEAPLREEVENQKEEDQYALDESGAKTYIDVNRDNDRGESNTNRERNGECHDDEAGEEVDKDDDDVEIKLNKKGTDSFLTLLVK